MLIIAMPVVAFEDSPAALRLQTEALCGPEIVLLGDAWEHVQLERDALFEISRSGDLVQVPQKLAALRSHFAFIQNRAVMVFGEERENIAKAVAELGSLSARWNGLALDGRREDLLVEWYLLVKLVKALGAQFPPEALVSSSEASFVLPPVVPTVLVKFDVPPLLQVGRETEVKFRLVGQGGVPVIPDQLHTTHTEKLHALLLDPAFRDYHHEHPRPTGIAGEYVFRFTPSEPGPYRMWLDVMPVSTGRGEFPIADLKPIPRPIAKAPAPLAAVTESASGEFLTKLELPPGGLTFGNVGTISVALEENGKPLLRLEPLMGAFAHVVGFGDDFQSILHIHPLGAMPIAGQQGGPRVDFQLRPLLPGWLRLYFQYQVDGKTHLSEFVVPVTVK